MTLQGRPLSWITPWMRSRERERFQQIDGHEKSNVKLSMERFRKKPLPDEVKYEWELPDEMVNYAQKHFERYVNERNMKDIVIKENPILENILKKLGRLDEHFKELLEELHRKRDINLDNF